MSKLIKGKIRAKEFYKRDRFMKPYALNDEQRRNTLKERFRFGYRAAIKLPSYRTEYHFDRDIIIWSHAFKRLQHKTQVFPHYLQDHYKRRLTHSLEVVGLATTLARALGLNEIATEVIALGHDIGHTPFGHAGEKALNEALKYLGTKDAFKDFVHAKKLPLFGFNHCVHAVEVLTKIEKREVLGKFARGLDLTFDIVDGVLKHIYGLPKDGYPFATLDVITSYSDFKIFGDNKGSLEAQCVWFADKLAYLLGDIEDGFNSEILSIKNIYEAIENNSSEEAKEFKAIMEFFFRSFSVDSKDITLDNIPFMRNRVIDLFIYNAYRNASKIIEQNDINSIGDVFAYKDRIVHVSNRWSELWSWFYKNIITKLLFNHKDVYAFNMKCEQIVKKLFLSYYKHPELIPLKYRNKTEESYAKMGISNNEVIRIIQARNYVAGMTDPYAILQYDKLFTASAPVSPDMK